MTTFSIYREAKGNFNPSNWQARRAAGQLECFQVSHSAPHPLPPAADTPEENPEEYCAATVHAHGVTKFVGATGVVQGVNRHVVSDQQIRERAGHERALQHSPAKSSRSAGAVHQCGGAVHDEPDDGRREQNGKNAHENFLPETGGRRDFGLSISHAFRKPRACFSIAAPCKQNISTIRTGLWRKSPKAMRCWRA